MDSLAGLDGSPQNKPSSIYYISILKMKKLKRLFEPPTCCPCRWAASLQHITTEVEKSMRHHAVSSVYISILKF